LYVRQPTAQSIIFNSAAFPVLRYLKFRCGVLRLAFQAEAVPKLRRLKLEFNAHSGEQYGDMLTGIERLSNLQEIAVRVGAAPGAEESDKMAAESVLKETISKHSRHLSFSVRRANSFEEEIPQFSDPAPSSSHLGLLWLMSLLNPMKSMRFRRCPLAVNTGGQMIQSNRQNRLNMQADLLVSITRREIRKRSPRIHHQLKLLPRGLGQIQWCKNPGMKDVQTEKMIFVGSRQELYFKKGFHLFHGNKGVLQKEAVQPHRQHLEGSR